MLWIGSSLGPVGRASIISYMRHGHRVRLHVFDEPIDVPDGTELVDAAKTAKSDWLLAMKYPERTSHALASDYFRLKLLQNAEGIWSDSDMLCLAPVKVTGSVLMGLQHETSINSAIFYLDPQSPMLSAVIDSFSESHIPNWMPWYQTYPVAIAHLLTFRPITPSIFRWGTYGPKAVTALAKRYDLSRFAEPTDVYYPLPANRWREVWEPGSSFDNYVTERSKTIHLWHAHHPDGASPPSSSALGRFIRDLGD